MIFRSLCLDGFLSFAPGSEPFELRPFQPIKARARAEALRWRLVPCGSREGTYVRFKRAWAEDPGDAHFLLVDSETKVTRSPRVHLQLGDGWDLDFAGGNEIHLMVQVMESWIVADPDALVAFYGPNFGAAKLPRRRDMEQEPKAGVVRTLREATKSTQKRSYHKVNHAGRLLQRIDRKRVQSRCRHCRRLFEALDRVLEDR